MSPNSLPCGGSSYRELTVDMNGILAEVSSPTLEDDFTVFNEEENYNCVVQCLDYGGPLTARETAEEVSTEVTEMEEEHIQRDAGVSTTRSPGRPKGSSFLIVRLKHDT